MGEPHMHRVGRRQFLWLAVAAALAGCANPVMNSGALGQSGRLSAAVGGGLKPRLSDLPTFEGIEVDGATQPITDSSIQDAVPTAHLQRVATDNNQFAFDLIGALRNASPHTNLVASPLSIYTAFAMLYAGSNGETAAQLADTLHYGVPANQLHPAIGAFVADLISEGSDDTIALSIANGLWGQQGYTYEPHYTEVLSRYYGAALQTTDFAHDTIGAVDAINEWISDATHGKIAHLLSQLDPATKLVLANAIYFNGNWATPFKSADTYDAPFTSIEGTTTDVATMHLTARFAYTETDGYQAVALPYKGGQARLIVLLPASDSLTNVEQTLTGTGFASLVGALDDSSTTRVALSLPRFEDTTTTTLQPPLAALGLTLPFSDNADFTGISRVEQLKVDQAIHQATIIVDEQGTEAAAATGIAVTTLSAMAPQPAIEMNVNRPFLYFLQAQKSGAILFAGRRMVV